MSRFFIAILGCEVHAAERRGPLPNGAHSPPRHVAPRCYYPMIASVAPRSELQPGGAILQILDVLPHRVQEIENVWIPMSDGCRLAARVWLPEGAESAPVPAILETIPYGKRDGTRVRDERMHGWFAGHGYAAVRVDIRGSGDSDGVLLDEYLLQEQEDALETIRWIASQPWCDGNVGIIGKSWGGIAALQIAARRPPALRAIITVCSTDDRWRTDAHWMGGCLLNENLAWGSLLMAIVAQPPDPAVVGERWREMWLQRLEAVQPFPEIWMRHPERDAYWKHGSVSLDPAAIECPVFAVSGWEDAYTGTVPRLLASLKAPRRGLVGPWAHVYPHEGAPGAAIGFLQEAKRWWDRWLRGVDNGITNEPMYRAWMPQAPDENHSLRPGRWVAEDVWPSPRIEMRRFDAIRDGSGTRLRDQRSPTMGAVTPPTIFEHRSQQTVGSTATPWCSFGDEDDPQPDQKEDDAGSLVFDSDPLAARFEILGPPVVHLALGRMPTDAQIAVRLCDVSPAGRSTRVSYGLLKLSAGDPRRGARANDPDLYELALRHTAHAFAPGHRIRVAISTSYWPIAWPAARATTLAIHAGVSGLELPERPPRAADAELAAFEPPVGARPGAVDELEPSGTRSEIEHDPATGMTRQRTWLDIDREYRPARVRFRAAADLETAHGIVETFEIAPEDPTSARAEFEHRTMRRRADWEVRIALAARLRTRRDAWLFEADLEARENDRIVLTRRWQAAVPRDAPPEPAS
jgi:putative CocE/NonD family hydrolase